MKFNLMIRKETLKKLKIAYSNRLKDLINRTHKKGKMNLFLYNSLMKISKKNKMRGLYLKSVKMMKFFKKLYKILKSLGQCWKSIRRESNNKYNFSKKISNKIEDSFKFLSNKSY